jgi:radical SAM superfamily enzyme YgiQ (UPF0313 family)
LERRLAENAGLGVLTLAAILEKCGVDCEVHHLSRHLFDLRDEDRCRDRARLCAERIAAGEFDAFGISTICSSYPFLLRFAHVVKRLRPDCTVILGGPQATVTDVATLNAFESVDLIVRGEADETLPRVLESLHERPRLALVPGITYRDGSRVVRNANAPPVLDLDSLPLPSFHLLPGARGAALLPIEIGRGCPFSCTFCSTNDFFRRRFRLKSDPVMVAQMSELHRRFGVTRFDLTHDMFTVDRRRVISFCRALLDSRSGLRWTCSARTDCIDEDLLDWMQQAGCVGVFFGIETGSARMQKVIDKGLDIEQARAAIRSCGKRSIQVTAATIIGFPEEEEPDLCATLQLLFEAAAQKHVAPQISLLAPLAGTPIESRYHNQLEFDGNSSDFCNQGFPQGPADLELIAAHVDVFQNFYTVPTRVPKALLQEIAAFATWVLYRCRWLAIALLREAGDPWILCRCWIDFRKKKVGSRQFGEYYSSTEFYRDFVRFSATIATGLEACTLLSVHSHILEIKEDSYVEDTSAHPLAFDGLPVVRESAAVFQVPIDPGTVVNALASGAKVSGEGAEPLSVAWCRHEDGGNLYRLPQVAVHLLELCNGKHTALAIASHLAVTSGSPIENTDPVAGWLAIMERFRSCGLLTYRPPGASDHRSHAGASRRSRTGVTSKTDTPRLRVAPKPGRGARRQSDGPQTSRT